ncbi:MAG: CRISPR-associated endonuclease Cas1, partial [Actinomycetota bacterium]
GNEISSLLESQSFDPFLGFFHGVKYGRRSLSQDIIEEFRQPLIDMFTLKLINKKVFTKVDFELHNNKSCHFVESSLKIYFEKYESLMNESVKDNYGEEKTWRNFLKRQVESLADAVLNQRNYIAFRF